MERGKWETGKRTGTPAANAASRETGNTPGSQRGGRQQRRTGSQKTPLKAPRSRLTPGLHVTGNGTSAGHLMNGHVVFQGGPFSGIQMEAKFHRIAKDIQQSPTRYPSRIVVEYDSISAEELQVNCPEAPFTAGRDTLVATYDFNEGTGVLEFRDWSTRLSRPLESLDGE